MMFTPGKTLIIENAHQIYMQGLDAIASGQTLIDLSDTATVDSTAVAVLLEWKKAAKERHVPLSFGKLPDSLASLATLYGATALLTEGV